MTWKRNKRLKERNCYEPIEQEYFKKGYRDGYNGKTIIINNDWPNAYSAGYWEGVGDKNDENQ